MPHVTRQDRLRARVGHTLDGLRRDHPDEPAPRGPNPAQLAALDAVLGDLSPARADDLIDAWGERHLRACVTDVIAEPRLRAIAESPVAAAPRLTAAIAALGLGAPPDGATLRGLHEASWFAGSHPPPGLAAAQRADLVARLDAGVPPTVVLDRLLAPHLVHTLARGPARPWTGGWPCWTLIEAAVTEVHRRAAPDHLLPATPGGALPGYRPLAMIGAYLGVWLGADATRRLATEATGPADVWGAHAGTVLALADLQRWMTWGGATLGPAWSDPFAWLKLLAVVAHGGPLDLRGVPAVPCVTPALAGPDLLALAGELDWHVLPVARRDDEPVAELLATAVAAMMVEEVSLASLHAMPSDPPAGELVLDVATCTLSAAPRAHRQFTEPARWLVPPGWAAGLRARGLRRAVLRGVRHGAPAHEALLGLTGPLREEVVLDLAPPRRRVHVAISPAPLQVRHHDALWAVGGALSEALGSRLREARFDVAPSPFGLTPDPLGAARALIWAADSAPLPRDLLIPSGGAWATRWHDPRLAWPSRAAAIAAVDARLAEARAAARRLRLLLLTWTTAHAWVDADGEVVAHPGLAAERRLLDVDVIVRATRAGLTALRQHTSGARVVLAVDPALDPNLDASAAHADKATLVLAARALSDEVEVLPAWEIFAQELRDDRWRDADGLGLTAEAEAALLDRLLDGWVAPVHREWARRHLAGEDTAAELDLHPLLPREPLRAPEPASAAPAGPSEATWRADLERLLAQAPETDQRLAWQRQLDELVDLISVLPDASAHQIDLLSALADPEAAIDDPELIAPACARTLAALARDADVAQVAPLLRAALQRRWIDDASPVVGDLSSSRREALGQAMLDGRPKPRRPLRTPLDRCLALLLDL